MSEEQILFENCTVDKFLFEERECTVVHPTVPSNGIWVWKAEYFDAFPNFEEAMVQRGYHIVFIDHDNRWASPDSIDQSARFLQFVAEKYNLKQRGIAVGMSCGGLISATLAEKYPELIDVLYLDAPVMNILSLAGLGDMKEPSVDSFRREIFDTYNLAPSSLVSFRGSPIDNMQPLIDHKIPVIMLYGNMDKVVIYLENGKVLEDFYRANSGTIKVIRKSMVGHHPHGLADPTPIIEWVEAHLGQAI